MVFVTGMRCARSTGDSEAGVGGLHKVVFVHVTLTV